MGSETNTWKFKCPCGKGVITHRVTDYDNSYSKADISTSFTCGCKYRVGLAGVGGHVAYTPLDPHHHIPLVEID